jgi:hypothetical protein
MVSGMATSTRTNQIDIKWPDEVAEIFKSDGYSALEQKVICIYFGDSRTGINPKNGIRRSIGYAAKTNWKYLRGTILIEDSTDKTTLGFRACSHRLKKVKILGE